MIGPGEYMAMLNVVEAWNEISWGDAIPFTLVLIGLYWVKVKIDASVGISKKQGRQLKKIIREAIDESELIK
tara:strand:+ start:267 stop:482 length:216 start_codon:yes stop_codon:yes gene_type:complete